MFKVAVCSIVRTSSGVKRILLWFEKSKLYRRSEDFPRKPTIATARQTKALIRPKLMPIPETKSSTFNQR